MNLSRRKNHAVQLTSHGKRERKEKVVGLSDLLYRLLEQARNIGIPVSGEILREKAKEIAEGLGDNSFKASNGFLYKWLKSYNVSLRCIKGESLSVNHSTIVEV